MLRFLFLRLDGALLILSLAAVASAAAGQEGHPRQRLFGLEPGEPVSAALAIPARLTVLFHPEVDVCSPHEIRVARALGRVAADFRDTRVYTVLPARAADLRKTYGVELPGENLVVSDDAFAAEGRIAPRPRIEVWSAEGRLLLMKSAPRAVTEEAVYDEVVETRAFTAPLDGPRRR